MRLRRGIGLESLLVALLSLAAAGLALRLWRTSFSVPWEYTANDSEYQLMLVKGVLSGGWWFSNGHLGAPFGQQLYDFAVGGDTLHILLIRLLGLFSDDAALVGNLFYLISFALAGAAAYAVIRDAGSRPAPSACAAILFAIVPYALLRSEHHAFLAADYAVPLGAGLALAVLEGRPVFAARDPGPDGSAVRTRRWLTKRTLLTAAACVAVGATGTFYYGVFTAALLVAAGLAAWWRSGRGALLAPAVCIAVIAATFLIDLAPTLIYQAANGVDHAIAHRPASDSDLYGLKLTQLVFPVPGERIGALANLSGRYRATTFPPAPNESYSSVLGLVGAVGFVALLLAVLGASATGGDDGRRERSLLRRLAAPGLLAMVAFLIGMVGGLGTAFAYVVTPQLRGWSRIAPFIAFLSLLAIARLLDHARVRWASSPRGGAAAGLLAAGVLLVGVLDQSSPGLVPDYGSSAAMWHADQAFAARIAVAMPAGAKIFELPYEPFPEGAPLRGTGSYDELRPYLAGPAGSSLRFSFGASRGRPADWAAQLALQPARVQLPAVAAAGFDGLLVDTAALPISAAASDQVLRAELGAPVGEGAQFAFYNLRPYAARMRSMASPSLLAAARLATLYPVTIGDPLAGSPAVRRLSASGTLLPLRNPTARTRAALLTLYVSGSPQQSLTITAPGVAGPVVLTPRSPGISSGTVVVRLTPGATTASVRSSSTGALSATITDVAQLQLAAALARHA
ncbi:MAG: hypothetical protein ACYDHH_23600 [Solirubrobacteraceae bacterium]